MASSKLRKTRPDPSFRSGAGAAGVAALLTGLIGLNLFAPAELPAQTPGSSGGAIWSGASGGFGIEWTAGDLIVRKGAAPAFSALEQWKAALDSGRPCTGGNSLVLVSVVGPIFSIREESGGECEGAAHPWAVVRMVARDAGRQGQPASLADLFPEADLLNALLGDKLVQEALNSGKSGPVPTRLSALIERIAAYPSEDCRWGFGSDLLSRFAIHHVEKDRVAVRIGLSHGCEVARGSFTQIGILLPVPPAWREALTRAAQRQEGFLMQDAPKLFGKKQTTWSFSAAARGAGGEARTPVPLRTVAWGESSFAGFSPDGRTGLTSKGNGALHVWDLETGRKVRTLTLAKGWVHSVTVSPDGALAAAGVSDGGIVLWELATGRERARLTGHRDDVWAVAFSPDGRFLLSGSGDAKVKLWDLRSWQEVRTFSGHTDYVRAVAFAQGGTAAVSASNDRTVRVWDLATGAQRYLLAGHKGGVWDLAVSPEGTQLLSCSDDKTVRLWDLATGEERQTLHGHQDRQYHVAFAPRGGIAASSDDNSVKLWNLATGEELASFAPDGRTLLAGSEDGVKIWQVPEPR